MFGTHLVAIVAILSLALYFYMGIRVGQARTKFNVPAPAMTGQPEFERTFRVQMNTLEGLVIYLPSLFLFAAYVHDYIAAALGVMWIVGRYVYMEGYIDAPEKRSAGFGIQALATLILLLGSLVGVLWNMAGIGAIL
ncbi:MAG: MAPEG family protein [Alphaproteobacteria bacterium]|nr:MAPEG family protein [Alphaproteobacteria bacterium]